MTDLGSRDPKARVSARAEPAPPPDRGQRRAGPSDPWNLVLGILGGALLGTGITFAILAAVGVLEEPAPQTIPPPTLTVPPPQAPPPTLGDQITTPSVAERVTPSTVYVQVSGFLSSGSGSGVVYGSDGYILTNHHVVDGFGDVSVIFSDGARFPATVVGSDPLTDLAVLLVDRTDVAAIDLGNSDALTIGEPAIAVGNPLGLAGGPSVTTGIVGALNRSLRVSAGETLYGLVQTDAPIAPGSSGGALVNAKAELIGITTAIAVSDAGAEGLGFAVPTAVAVGVATDLINTGEVDHARLGVEVSTAWAQEGDAEFPVGISVEGVAGNSPYQTGGGRINDVIVNFGGRPVTTEDDLLAWLRRHRAEEVVDVHILRADEDRVLQIELGSLS